MMSMHTGLIQRAFYTLAEDIHCNAVEKGFWTRNGSRQDAHDPGVAAEKIALIHSELSEALEAVRKGSPLSAHIPAFDGFDEEMADTVIRVIDLCEARGVDLGAAILAKIEFNEGREYMHGGKTL